MHSKGCTIIVGSICVCLSLSQHSSTFHFTNEQSEPYSAAYECQKSCEDLSEMTVFRSYGVIHKQKAKMLTTLAYPQSVSHLMYSEVPEVLSVTSSLAPNNNY